MQNIKFYQTPVDDFYKIIKLYSPGVTQFEH